LTPAAGFGGWRVEERIGHAAQLHGSWPAVDDRPEIRAVAVCRPTSPALVLGSTQPDSLVDRDAAARSGTDVVRRRSGGGAVLVRPADPLWVDVWVPAGDRLFEPDVGRAFWWLGDVWRAALDGFGVRGLSVVRGAPAPDPGPLAVACFGSAGSGEVVTADGRKVVGLSQRRVRAGSRFSAACLDRWDPAALVALLAGDDDERRSLRHRLDPVAVGLDELLPDVPDVAGVPGGTAPRLGRVVRAFLDALP
jgi:lipoate---protein ligase